jgi:hypothetical protein
MHYILCTTYIVVRCARANANTTSKLHYMRSPSPYGYFRLNTNERPNKKRKYVVSCIKLGKIGRLFPMLWKNITKIGVDTGRRLIATFWARFCLCLGRWFEFDRFPHHRPT